MLYNLFENRDFVSVFAVALLAEGVDRNVLLVFIVNAPDVSPSSRRAWIEIADVGADVLYPLDVALLAEGVDRNHQKLAPFVPAEVALLAEGVDRNMDSQKDVWGDFGRPPRGGRG